MCNYYVQTVQRTAECKGAAVLAYYCDVLCTWWLCANSARVQGSCCSGLLLRYAVHLMIMCTQCNSARELLFWLITAIRSGEWQEGRKFPLPTSSSDAFDNNQGSSNWWWWRWWWLLRLVSCALKNNLNFMESLISIYTSLAFPLKRASNPRECNILQCRVIKVLLIAGKDKGSRLFKVEHTYKRQAPRRVQRKCSNLFGFLSFLFLPQLQFRFRYAWCSKFINVSS